jgi:hypothetical protein
MLPTLTETTTPLETFKQGNQTFGLLFTRWMDTNRWSHPVMVNLAKSCLDNVGWLHSSQISGLRHVKLASPGPRTFVAIERLNFYMHRYATTKTLLPNTSSSNFYSEAYAITEDGKPPELGWWVEVFCGQRVPKDIDLRQTFFVDEQAESFSLRWGHMIRRLMMQRGVDVIMELDNVVRSSYAPRDAARVKKLMAVIQNQGFWNADELTNELPAITDLTAEMGGPATEQELISEIQR